MDTVCCKKVEVENVKNTLFLVYYAKRWRIKAGGRSLSLGNVHIPYLCPDNQMLTQGCKTKSVSADAEWFLQCSNPQTLNYISERLQKPRKSILEDSFTLTNANTKG